jgi:hypothetical protein
MDFDSFESVTNMKKKQLATNPTRCQDSALLA